MKSLQAKKFKLNYLAQCILHVMYNPSEYSETTVDSDTQSED